MVGQFVVHLMFLRTPGRLKKIRRKMLLFTLTIKPEDVRAGHREPVLVSQEDQKRWYDEKA